MVYEIAATGRRASESNGHGTSSHLAQVGSLRLPIDGCPYLTRCRLLPTQIRTTVTHLGFAQYAENPSRVVKT